MKWTISSLYLMVFIALIGLGWGIDQVYDHYQDQTLKPLAAYKLTLGSVKRALDTSALGQQVISERSAMLPDLFQIDQPQNFPLPDILQSKLDAGEIIVLESEHGLSLHQKLDNYHAILGLGPVPNPGAKPQLMEFFLTVLFYLGVALVLIVWITPLVKSVQLLSAGAKEVGRGNLHLRLNTRTIYLTALYRDFNSMVDRLQTLSDNNQLFSQAVAHDIRTPMARIRFALEKLNREKSTPLQVQIFEKIHQDVSNIENLSADLLDYARIEQTRKLQIDTLDLNVFLQQLLAEFSEHYDRIDYQTDHSKIWEYPTDATLLYKVINNLIDNALFFSQQNIRVRLHQSAEHFDITVEDDGPGIDPKLLGTLFKPFFQGRQSSKNHFGLGLAICQRATGLLGGSIRADNGSTLGGARFDLRLPRHNRLTG